MVNTEQIQRTGSLRAVTWLVGVYVVSVLATIVGLVILSSVAPKAATTEAWVHEIIVAVFAIVLPLRLRSARRGNDRARVAVGIIAIVLVAVNVVEAVIPGFVPDWMRIEMVATAVLMGVVAVLALRKQR